MARGDVFNVDMPLPDGGTKRKHVVVLQEGPGFDDSRQVAVVLANSDKRIGKPTRPFEVRRGVPAGFDHETLIDCRWVFTLARAEVVAGQYLLTLDGDAMDEIDAALKVGLQVG